VLADQSWTDLWGVLLNPDFNYDQHYLASGDAKTDGTSLCYAQEGIESWVAEDLPLSSALSSQSEQTTVNTILEEPMKGPAGQHCYGMVRRLSFAPLRKIVSLLWL
jgi:hypothetical protein